MIEVPIQDNEWSIGSHELKHSTQQVQPPWDNLLEANSGHTNQCLLHLTGRRHDQGCNLLISELILKFSFVDEVAHFYQPLSDAIVLLSGQLRLLNFTLKECRKTQLYKWIYVISTMIVNGGPVEPTGILLHAVAPWYQDCAFLSLSLSLTLGSHYFEKAKE